MLRTFFVRLSENRSLRSFAEQSAIGRRVSGRFVAGTEIADADGVSDFGAGHEAPRYPASDCGLFGKTAQRSVFRKADEERPQHAVPARSEMVRKGVLRTVMKITEI